MPVRATLLLLALAAVARAESRPTAALVVVPGSDAAGIASARADPARQHRLIEDARVRALLEGLARPPGAEDRVREALVRTQERLRRFDLEGTRAAIAEAWAASAGLAPTGAWALPAPGGLIAGGSF